MAKIIFDIETLGGDFEQLDETSKEYFLRFAETEQEVTDAKNSLSFYPLTAQIVTIAMIDAASDKGLVLFQNEGEKAEKFKEGDVSYVSGDERFILEKFWMQMQKCSQFVTFNGRVFDCPFIMIRSAINNIRPTKNIMPYRYAHNQHIDLADQLAFYGAMQRKFSLHMWCNAFGIASPKAQGVSGLDVKDMYKEGKYQDIARYCVQDVLATRKLYQYWDKCLKF